MAQNYRYRGRRIGHSFDNDASIFTVGGVLIDNSDNSWMVTLGYGKLNRHGPEDIRNTVARVQTEYREIELSHSRSIAFGELSAGLGYDDRKNTVTGDSDGDVSAFLEWRYTY